MQLIRLLALAISGSSFLASAHPGHVEEEATDGLKGFKLAARSAAERCTFHWKESGLEARNIARREAMLKTHRRRLRARDSETVLNASHYVSDVSLNSPYEDVWNASTIVLNPEGETGPYWVVGERLRSNLLESQPGVPVIIEEQFIDIETCDPITDLFAEIWSCNSTGVYSGLVASGNGNPTDTSNHNTTFLRGIQRTDVDGIVTFETLFPGHYAGRTNHHHVIAHLNTTLLPNNTLDGGYTPHVGQYFYDQDLIDRVESTYPYNTNTITQTTNAVDRVFAQETENTTSDPVLHYAYLGEKLEDGIFAWVQTAINTSSSAIDYPYYTNVFTADGGKNVTGTDCGSFTIIDGGACASATPLPA
jgi:protocatechuate 3,4-dioxygenase beta subunit